MAAIPCSFKHGANMLHKVQLFVAGGNLQTWRL
jgi:hypothetical protein